MFDEFDRVPGVLVERRSFLSVAAAAIGATTLGRSPFCTPPTAA